MARLTEAEKAQREVARSYDEKTWQRMVLDWAAAEGWKTAHFNDSRKQVTRRDGQVLYVGDKDAKGWPDTILVKGDTLMVAELKKEDGALTPEQVDWLDALAAADVPCFVWKPRHRFQILSILAGEQEPPGGWSTSWKNMTAAKERQ